MTPDLPARRPRAVPALALLLALGAGTGVRAQEGPPPLPFVLHLRTEQAEAYRAYRDELALERADAARAAGEVSRLNAMTTPERLDQSLADLPRREAQARRQAGAVRAFYAVLSPEQRRVFDRVTRAPEPPPQQTAEAPRASGPPLPLPPEGAPLPPPAG